MFSMYIFIILSLLTNCYSFSRSVEGYGCSYGNYNTAIFNSKRNEYFWEKKNNIIPIQKEKARIISNSWKISQINKENFQKSKYVKYYEDSYYTKSLCYAWVPLNDKSDIRGLITVYVDLSSKIIFISRILPNPYLYSFDFEYLKSDINQLKFQDGFKNFNISYEKFSDDDEIMK